MSQGHGHKRRRHRKLVIKWSLVVGVALALIFCLPAVRHALFWHKEAPAQEEHVFNPGVPRLETLDACGEKAFWANLKDFPQGHAAAKITLGSCGFRPALSRIGHFFGFVVKNTLSKPANIQILAFTPDGRNRGFNRVLKSGESLELHRGTFNIADTETVMVYIDSDPSKGVATVFLNEQTGLYKATREPVGIVPLDFYQ